MRLMMVAALALAAFSGCRPTDTTNEGSNGTGPRPTGNFIALEFTGPDFDGPLSFEFSGDSAPSISTPNGKLSLGKIISNPAELLTAKEDHVATCAQASLGDRSATPGCAAGEFVS